MTMKQLDQLISSAVVSSTPTGKYNPDIGTVQWRLIAGTGIAQEIFQRPTGTFGFRYRAWAAWRDAGGIVREHSWFEFRGIDALVTDTLQSAVSAAESDATARGAATSPWTVASRPDN
jgi:hypothetical protein